MNVDLILADLRCDEGVRSVPYRDTVGKLTIGIGRNLDDVALSDSEAEFMCRNDIERAALGLDRLIAEWRSFPEPVQRALVNMVFNMGITGFAKFQNMIAALRKGDWDEAANQALRSSWAEQVGARAERIAVLLRSV